jgi:hypothetical protein
MATLLKVLNNLADIKSAGSVALHVRTQGALLALLGKAASLCRNGNQLNEIGNTSAWRIPLSTTELGRSHLDPLLSFPIQPHTGGEHQKAGVGATGIMRQRTCMGRLVSRVL